VSSYPPLPYDPNGINPQWQRLVLAFAVTQKCEFVDEQSKMKLAIAGLQGKALSPPAPQDPIIEADATAILNASPDKLCNERMASFVRTQAAAAKPDYGAHPKLQQ
jgi:hypothetical protein